MKMRIGHGYDVHRFTQGNAIVMGGVNIPYSQALLAHSDGDVLSHAICDALLGAAGLGDIGHWFPDTDAQYRDANSRELLKQVVAKIHDAGWAVANVDATIVAQAPKMAPSIDAMRHNMAIDLQVEIGDVNVKATTTEGLGMIGRKEGIAVHAVALLCTLTNR